MSLSREEQRRILLKAETLDDQGHTTLEICEILSIKPKELQWLRRREIELLSVSGPWQKIHNGKTWEDMPGHDFFAKRCNFALFRRGLRIYTTKDQGWVKSRGRPRKKPIVDPEDIAAAEIVPLSAELGW